MAANNSLEGFALKNLTEIASVGSNDRVRVVAEVARGSPRYRDEGVLNLEPWIGVKRVVIERGSLSQLSDLGNADMSDPTTLRDFLIWAKTAFPSRHYALVLWDHGGGWEGYGVDDGGSRNAPMSIPDLRDALKAAALPFDLLGFDACLMASVEVAFELQPYAKVMVASEEVEPGSGWDYRSILGALSRRPDASARDMGRSIAESYLPYTKQRPRGDRQALFATMSVIDLEQIPAVASSFRALVADMTTYVGEGDGERLARLGKITGQARYESPPFGRQTFVDPGREFDLGLVADNVARVTGDPHLAASAAGLRAAIAKAIPISIAGEGYKTAPPSGLSVFIPATRDIADAAKSDYGRLAATTALGWPSFLDAFAKATASDAGKPAVARPSASTLVLAPGKATATITSRVTDDVMVAGVTVGVAGLADGRIYGFDELPRTYAKTNDVRYSFDAQAWALAAAGGDRFVFAVGWDPGQRAVFGIYREDARSSEKRAYFVYDEISGDLIQGFVQEQGALGPALPSAESTFRPLLEPLEGSEKAAAPVNILETSLKRRPLPAGPYLITFTGYNIGGGKASSSVLVAVTGG